MLRQEADRIMRHLEDLDLARERAVVLQEELLSHIAQEQNARMNVGGLPGVDSRLGFATSVVVMVAAAIGLAAFFRWKKWL